MRTTAWITGVLTITAGLAMAGSSPCFAIDTPETGYKITSTDRTIDVFGSCKQVRASRSLFAPTKSSNEWNGFLGWANSNTNTLTLTACPTCSDGIQNQGEEGIDCGGPCAACSVSCGGYGVSCTNGCCPGLSCQTPLGSIVSACFPSTTPCTPIGSPCTSDAECCPGSGGCNIAIIGGLAQVCMGPTCSDGVQNQGETGVDCGGPCAACDPSCGDGVCNNGELSSTCCADCPCPSSYFCPSAGLKCCPDGYHWDTDDCCDSGWHRNPSGPGCVPDAEGPSCSDGIQNQGETGVDCGGPCAACPPPSPECSQDSDCSTSGSCYICSGGVCENTAIDCHKCADGDPGQGPYGYGRISQTFCGSCQNGFTIGPVDGCPCENDNYFCGGAPCQWNYDQQACVQP